MRLMYRPINHITNQSNSSRLNPMKRFQHALPGWMHAGSLYHSSWGPGHTKVERGECNRSSPGSMPCRSGFVLGEEVFEQLKVAADDVSIALKQAAPCPERHQS